MIVPVAERELHTVAPDVFRVENSQIIGDGARIDYSKSGNFAYAVGAHAFGSKILDRVNADVTIVPTNGDLGCACFLYFERCWHKEVRGQ